MATRPPTDPLADLAYDLELEAAHVTALLRRLRLTWLLRHLPPRGVWAAYVFVNGFVTIALLALLAGLTGTPFVFPSLGPTAYLFFFAPLAPTSSPRNAVCGHAIGLACGYAALRLTGASFPAPVHTGLYWPNLLSAALSLAASGAFMVLLDVGHPPAGATTLIVSLGIIRRPYYLLVIEGAVVLLTIQAVAINRLAGLAYPLWAGRRRPWTPDLRDRAGLPARPPP